MTVRDTVALAPIPSRTATTATRHAAAIADTLAARRALFDTSLAWLMTRRSVLAEAAARLVETLRTGHTVLVAGNGGSAAEAQHFAAEMVGRFKHDRSPYAVLSLAADTAILTALANDYGYPDVFARQVHAHGRPGDLLVAFSTSGESENVVRAAAAAHERLMTVVAVTGERASALARLADVALRMPSDDTAFVQELHMVVTHLLCDMAESALMAHDGCSR